MNNKKMITEITEEQIDELLTYTASYTEQSAANIKKLALDRIKPKKSPRYRQILIAAVLMLALSIGVSAYYITAIFFAPGYGILQDADFTIYATKAKVRLGDFIVDAVTRTVDGDESTVCMWLFQAEEIESFMTEEERMIGLPPLQFTDITAVFDDGTELKAISGGLSIPGFGSYIFRDAPDANTFRLRDIYGNEATVTLEDISKTEYANLKGIKFDDVSMTVVPLSGTGNIFAAEVTDKLTLNLSKYAASTSVKAWFFLEAANGDMGYASGNTMLNGYNDNYKYSAVEVNANSYDMNAEKLKLWDLLIWHDFWNLESSERTFIVPNEGESVNCNITMFDAEGIKFKIKSIKNENGVLTFETETTDNVKGKHRTKAHFYFQVGIYDDLKMEDYGVKDEQGNPEKSVYNVFMNLQYYDDGNYNENVAKFTTSTSHSVSGTTVERKINPGDECAIQLNSMRYNYQYDNKMERADGEAPSQNLGVINLK